MAWLRTSCVRKTVKSVSELSAHGKADPDKLNDASAGIGNTMHLWAEHFQTPG